MQHSGHTPEWSGQAVERVMSNGKRVFALPFRRWLVGQACKPGASVAGLALRHGINANQLRRWIKVERGPECAGQGVSLLPVTIGALPATAAPAIAPVPEPAGHIEVQVLGARLKLYAPVDAQSLRVVLDVLAQSR